MAEKLNLNRFKASGVYTVEVDESTNLSLPLSTGRLVIGSSKKGPINSVVLVNDTRTLKAVYGETDTKLEKNGSYFHRTIDVALRQGPIFALNILPVSETDVAHFATFNTEAASNNSAWSADSTSRTGFCSSLSNFYNTQKLWFADADQLSKYKNLQLGDSFPSSGTITRDSNKILSLVNLSRKPITTWIRIAETTGYNITVSEYYKLLGDRVEIPEFLHPDDYISDYFVEVIAVEGDWTDYVRLAKDPIYKGYFNKSGIELNRINDFLSLREITVVNRTIGSIIPDFRDLTGTIASIDTLFNRKFSQSGLLIALDSRKIDQIDLTVSSFDSGSSTEPMASQRIDLVGHGFDELDYTAYSIDNGTDLTEAVKLIDTISYKKPAGNNYYFRVEATVTTNLGNEFANGDHYLVDRGGDKYIVATHGSKLYSAWEGGFVSTGDTINYISGPSNTPAIGYIGTDDLVKTQNTGQVKYIEFLVYSDATRSNQISAEFLTISGENFFNIVSENISTRFKYEFSLTDSSFFITSGANNFKYFAPNQIVLTLDPSLYGYAPKKEVPNSSSVVTYNQANRQIIEEFFKTGQYIKAGIVKDSNGDPVIRQRLLKIRSVFAKLITVNYGVSNTPVKTLQYTITVDTPTDSNVTGIDLTNSILSTYKGFKNYVTDLRGTFIPSIKVDDSELYPDGSAAKADPSGFQDKLFSYLYTNTNLASTIADGETLDLRYIIDSYQGQISPSSKQYLVQLAADHGKALAIVNAPSIAQYENSIDPSFIDINTNLVSMEYISTGGNISSNPQFTFDFASGDKNGIPISSYAAYFMPNLIIFDGGRNKSVPPSAYVANAYMTKYNSGNTFSIVAGKRGIISDPEVSGVEYDFTNEDREFLEPAGYNLIVRRRGFGVMIYSNNTAYQRVRTALNNIHVREALITIERDIERILLNFLFEFNDPTTRLRVKTLVKNYMTSVQEANGVTSFEVIFDDSNNGPEVLENNAGIVDIIVNFPRGIHKFINRITITRANGQLSSQSTGFTPSF